MLRHALTGTRPPVRLPCRRRGSLGLPSIVIYAPTADDALAVAHARGWEPMPGSATASDPDYVHVGPDGSANLQGA